MQQPEAQECGTHRAQVVADLARLLKEWQAGLRTHVDTQRLPYTEPSEELEPRARAAGFGGIGHHLAVLARAARERADDQVKSSLEALAELAWQARLELNEVERTHVDRSLAEAAGRVRSAEHAGPAPAPGPSPVPDFSPAAEAGPGEIEMPPLLSIRLPQSPWAIRNAAASAPIPEPIHAPEPEPIHAPEQAAIPDLTAHQSRTERSGEGVALPPVLGEQRPAQTAQFEAAALSKSAETRAPSPFQVRNMLGLSGNRNPVTAAMSASPRPTPAPIDDSRPSLLGLGTTGNRRQSAHSPPPLVADDPSGLPPLTEVGPSRKQAANHGMAFNDLKQRLERIKSDGSSPSAKPDRQPKRQLQRAAARGRAPLRGKARGNTWIVVGIVAVGFGLLAVVALVVLGRRGTQEQEEPEARPLVGEAQAAPESTSPSERLPTPGITFPEERFNELMRAVHGHGGEASPELRALLQEQAAVAAQSLTAGDCSASADPRCAAWAAMRKTLLSDEQIRIRKRDGAPASRARWLDGFKLPSIPIEDDPKVQRVFEYFSENTVGRERFQLMLFRCGAYKDLIQATLVRHELPIDLQALVFAESGCLPTAESPVGAAGLWQFMPATGRAYHLRLEEGVVDERLSPQKSTQAAVQFLAHLKKKLGNWDLALASYNLGPFGVLARIQRAGGDVGFWELMDAGLLPDETANYVPTIQAFALILANLQKLKFAGSQVTPPQVTAELDAPPGTRLSMLARAAATSTLALKGLNPDVLGEQVPDVAGGFAIQVNKQVVWQARDTLKALLAAGDDADLCVSPSFDWGRQRFTSQMAKQCHRKSQAN